jgi:hypothetical protein
VTTLIIILLVLVAIGIVWAVVSNILSEGSDQAGLEQFSVDINFLQASVSGNDIILTVKRAAGLGNMTGMKFILSDGSNSEEFTQSTGLTELQAKTFTVTPTTFSPSNIKTASIAPLFIRSGEEVLGDVTDIYTFSGSSSGNNGNGNPNTGVCGDGIIQTPNGNSITEQCDGTNLGGNSCTTIIGGFVGGTLSCNMQCQFDTSQCIANVPTSCNGAWSPPEDSGVLCDGTPLPNGCTAICICEPGFSATGTGECVINSPINEGTINSVWNKIYFDSQNLPKSQVTMAGYIGYYVNFSNSPEVACFPITFADYVTETDISYLRLEDALGFPNIAQNENYQIWQAQNCGL